MFIILIFGIISFFLGVILSITTYKLQSSKDPTIEIVNELLPQIQCAQCGYSGCYPYAEAIIKNSEKIDKCTPGGSELVIEIANLLNLDISTEKSTIKHKKEISTVWIDEKNCVGCSKCAIFCPVDAIVGAPNFMHTVLQNFCTGCNICIIHCPTNCIKVKKENYEKQQIISKI